MYLEDGGSPIWEDYSKLLSSFFHSFDGLNFFWGEIDELSICCDSCRCNRLRKGNNSAVGLVWDQDGTNADVVLVSNGKEFFILKDRWISWTEWWVGLKEDTIFFGELLYVSLRSLLAIKSENLDVDTPETSKRGFQLGWPPVWYGKSSRFLRGFPCWSY